MDRRDAVKAMTLGAVGAGYAVPGPLLEEFLRALEKGSYQARFFGAAELETMRLLADMIIPRDERSGSATDAGTVEYVDFVLSASDEEARGRFRRGLEWLDREARERDGSPDFVNARAETRAAILDLVAWPARAEPRYADQVAWFNRARDLVGSGFFSSRMGVEDLRFVGGTVNPVWTGAPPEALAELGLDGYEAWDRRYGAPS